MPEPETTESLPGGMQNLSREERKSVTHGDFWIPEEEREVYKATLRALNAAEVPYVISGAYAIYEHTGIYRQTKDLDIFIEPVHVVRAARVLADAGFRTRLEQPHWLAKAKRDPFFVDLIYGMGNGLALIDRDWYEHGSDAVLAATPVRVAPVEELIWHRLFISERHRHDIADVLHLIQCKGQAIDWDRLIRKVGMHWPLLLAQLQTFVYVYPSYTDRIPPEILRDLLNRALKALEEEPGHHDRVTRGTMISRFSYAIDVNEWGFRDLRAENTAEMCRNPLVREIVESDVWQERSESAQWDGA